MNTKNSKKKSKAFTLLELLIVLLIVTIITSVAVLAFGAFGQERHLQSTAEYLRSILQEARQQAILQPAILQLKPAPKGIVFLQYWVNEKTHQSRWRQLPADTLSAPNLFQDTHYQMRLLSRSAKTIVFLPDGDVTPFRITLRSGSKSAISVSVLPSGTVTVKKQ